MAQGHRFKSEWPSEGLSGAPRPHSGRFGRFAKPSRNGRSLRTAAVHCVVRARPKFLPRRLLAAGFGMPLALSRRDKADKSVSSVRELDEFQGVYRCAPFFLRPLQRKHQLLGAGSTGARQNYPTDGKRDPDDHPDRSEVYETEREENKHCRSDDRAGLSSQHEPSAALDRFSEFLNTNLKSLDLIHGRESDFKVRSLL